MSYRRPVFFVVIAAALAATVYFGLRWQRETAAPAGTTASAPPAGRPGAGPGGPLPVEVMKVETRAVKDEINAVGNVRAEDSVMIKPEIAGRIARIAFTEGQRVPRGAVLVELDAQVARAEAAQAKAQLDLARTQYQRTVELAERQFVSSSARDQAASNLQVNEAAHALAQARLDRFTLRAPFAGVVGLRNVSPGDYVKDGADLVRLDDASRVKLDFRLPERYSAQLRAGQAVEFTVDALPGKVFRAQVLAVDPEVDANGRSLLVRARADNPDGALKSGMFARVRLQLAERPAAIVIPEEALVPSATGQVVFRVIDGKAVRTPVVAGLRQDGRVEIQRGLAAGEIIVTSGQIRLQRDNLPVRVVDGTAPAKAAPAAGNGAAR